MVSFEAHNPPSCSEGELSKTSAFDEIPIISVLFLSIRIFVLIRSFFSCSLEASAGLASHLGAAVDDIPSSSYSYDPTSACDPVAASAFAAAQGSELLHQPCPGVPCSPRSSHADLDGDHGSSLLLSPRGFDSLDGLPTENLNSVSYCFFTCDLWKHCSSYLYTMVCRLS